MFYFYKGAFYYILHCFDLILSIFQILFLDLFFLLFLIQATIRASSMLHNDLLQKVLHSPMLFFETNPIGRMQNLFSKDMDEGLLLKSNSDLYL